MSQSTARVGVIGDLMLEHFEGFSLAGDGASSQRIVGRGGAMCFFNWRNIAITLKTPQ